jgi:DNA-binding transcriptional ArsR family regulator
MNSNPLLRPTARLTLRALAQSITPMTITELAIATGSTALTLTRTIQEMCRAGLVTRIWVGKRTVYSLPTSVAITTTTNPAA